MKADKYVNGEYRGQIEVSDNGLIGSMARNDISGWLDNIRKLHEELTALGCTVVIEQFPEVDDE